MHQILVTPLLISTMYCLERLVYKLTDCVEININSVHLVFPTSSVYLQAHLQIHWI